MEEQINHIKAIHGYFLTDRKLINFFKNQPDNQNLALIKAKVMSLANHSKIDYFISDIFPNHIKNLEIDSCLKIGDLRIVHQMAKDPSKGVIGHEGLELASKYCAAHVPGHFPIWDNHSLSITKAYSKDTFAPSDYLKFSTVVQNMRSKYNMYPLNFFDISKFFWIYQDYLINYFYEKNTSSIKGLRST